MSSSTVAAVVASFIIRIANYMRACIPCLTVETSEERRMVADVAEACRLAKRAFYTWSATEGLRQILDGSGRPQATQIPDTEGIGGALAEASKIEGACIVWRDLQTIPLDRMPAEARLLRDCLASGPEVGRLSILVGPSVKPTPECASLCKPVNYSLPTSDDLARTVATIADSAPESADRARLAATPEILRALSGLSVSEAENALALSLIEDNGFAPAIIYREKCASVSRGGLLKVSAPNPLGLSAVGGLEVLKGWIGQRRNAYSPEAKAYGIPTPKGVLCVGFPGCGKSLFADAVATSMGVPLFRLDIGRLMGGIVGDTERNTREVLASVDANAPCVLFVDEIDKALSGSTGSNDGGVTRRMVGAFLTWLQEHVSDVFVIATANNVSALPPELYRRGRWDEIFAVDLPTVAERAQIVRVQASKHVRNPEARKAIEAGAAQVARETKEFSGAEIEAALIAALFAAFSDGARPVTVDDVINATSEIVPLATMAKAQVAEMRAWAKSNARNAGLPEVAPLTAHAIG